MRERLDHLLSRLAYCSRSEARAWLKQGRVTVAGAAVKDPSAKVDPADVRIDGQPPDHPDGLLVLLHKPVGYTCSHDPAEAPLVYDLLPPAWPRRKPPLTTVGRLDKPTSGLLLLTDIPGLVHEWTHPNRDHPKLYAATLDRDPDPAWAAVFAAGTILLEGDPRPCRPARFAIRRGREVEVELTEGRYHQVRRMFAALGATVLELHREKFSAYTLDDLAPGQWRLLPPPE